jgi:hypothetical protein
MLLVGKCAKRKVTYPINSTLAVTAQREVKRGRGGREVGKARMIAETALRWT